MLSNKEIAKAFQLLGELMELHGENPFKIRSYQNAYMTLRKLDQPLSGLSLEELEAIKGVGQAISGKIRELLETGKMPTLEKYKSMTPEGVQEMLQIKGFGPKKVQVLWKDLGVENIGELWYAINENRLLELKGFGPKTQEDLRQQLEYYLRSKNQFHFASLEGEGLELINRLREKLPGVPVDLTGAIRRSCNVLERIEVLIGKPDFSPEMLPEVLSESAKVNDESWDAVSPAGFPVRIYVCPSVSFGSKQFRYTASDDFLKAFVTSAPGLDFSGQQEETGVFELAGLPFIAPELREEASILEKARQNALPILIREQDILGVIHTHTTYSDGANSLQELARYVRDAGFRYLVVSDHSKSAVYANGLSVDRLFQQIEEIDALNRQMAPFRIFRSIESDILGDGSLDYPDEVLSRLDLVIASVHSGLKMDESKATQRLIRAIENPHTRILGHPTGRLLLSRPEYPIDHRRVIDACAANGVAIELNANPYRLDLDWTWIPYALEKGVWIAINPDAHSLNGVGDIHFGVCSARKGGLTADRCLNAMDEVTFAAWLERGR